MLASMKENDKLQSYNSKNDMEDTSYFLQFGVVAFFVLLLLLNFGNFFFFKNATRELRMALIRVDKEIVEENRRLSVVQAEFSKKYNVQNLQEMAKDRLNLQFSNVSQIKDMHEVLGR